MSVVETAYLVEVSAEALEELLVVRQEGHPVAVGLGVVEGDDRVLEIEVLDAQAQGFEQPQTATVEKAGDEIRHGVKFGEDAEAFVMVEVGLDVGAFLGAEGMQVAEGDAEDLLVEEQESGEGLGLGRGRDLVLGDEMSQERFDFRRSHCAGVAQVMEADIAFVPVDVSLFGAIGISA